MNTYKIELHIKTIDKEYTMTERWSGYTEQGAIAQAFLYYGITGARAIEVLSVELIKTN